MFHNWIGEDGADHCLQCGVITVDFGWGIMSDHGPLPLFCPGNDVGEPHRFVRLTKDDQSIGCEGCGLVLDEDSLPDDVDWECDRVEDYPAVYGVDWQGHAAVGDYWVSVQYQARDNEDREVWDVDIRGIDVGPIRSGVRGSLTPNEALATVLTFLSAWAEALDSVDRGNFSDNEEMFDYRLADWAREVGSEGFSMAEQDLEYQ